jgi:glycosyltransferase involved in cell wall biosynthesis
VPRVSVIIPTYNWSTVLPYSIGSVLRQTFSDFELLVVGDGCTDDSEAVVRRFTGDPRVRWINLATNTGHQSGPNNEGLCQARGELIAYLGHDDLWLPRHLELAVRAIDGGGGQADLTYAITEMVSANPAEALTFEPSEMEHYEPGLWIPPTSVVHRRELAQRVGGWRHFCHVNLDPEADLWQRMHAAGARFGYVRRLTAVKFPAIWRKDAYRLRRCDEQAAWATRIEREPDFESTELARMLLPVFADGRPNRPWWEVLREFGDDVLARVRRRSGRAGPRGAADRRAFFRARRKFKGLEG